MNEQTKPGRGDDIPPEMVTESTCALREAMMRASIAEGLAALRLETQRDLNALKEEIVGRITAVFVNGPMMRTQVAIAALEAKIDEAARIRDDQRQDRQPSDKGDLSTFKNIVISALLGGLISGAIMFTSFILTRQSMLDRAVSAVTQPVQK